MAGAMRAAEHAAVRLDPVADDGAVAMAAAWRHHADRALEAVEGLRPARHRDLEGLVVVVPAPVAASHASLLGLRSGGTAAAMHMPMAGTAAAFRRAASSAGRADPFPRDRPLVRGAGPVRRCGRPTRNGPIGQFLRPPGRAIAKSPHFPC